MQEATLKQRAQRELDSAQRELQQAQPDLASLRQRLQASSSDAAHAQDEAAVQVRAALERTQTALQCATSRLCRGVLQHRSVLHWLGLDVAIVVDTSGHDASLCWCHAWP